MPRPPDQSVPSGNPKDLIGVKKAPLRHVPPSLAIKVAPVFELGAIKYNDGKPTNWRQYPVRYSVYYEAAQRHMAAAYDGENLDPESGQEHEAHAAACLGIIMDARATGTLIDDRPVPGPAAALLAGQDKSARFNWDLEGKQDSALIDYSPEPNYRLPDPDHELEVESAPPPDYDAYADPFHGGRNEGEDRGGYDE